MGNQSLTQRGPNATTPAKLPGLQALRLQDPQAHKAVEALREWVEVRLGSRGDKYEKAVTLREFDKLLAPVRDKLAELKDFNGDINTLRTTKLNDLPAVITAGAFVLLATGDLYFGTDSAWKKVTLT